MTLKLSKLLLFILAIAAMVAIVIFLVSNKDATSNSNEPVTDNGQQVEPSTTPDVTDNGNVSNAGENDSNLEKVEPTSKPIEVDTDPESVSVIVNKSYKLPDDYSPSDLVYPDVRFTFKEKIEKRMMRQEAATALEKMFEAAEVDGIYLAGVSAYRSHATQTALFNRYVERDGYDKAVTYSAVPGTSEHETGLAIDVSASDGKCAAQDCFGDTVEAVWLAENAAEYGFIIRYPEGKEDITGYKYEPWHLRYVGVEISKEIASAGITLEEYYEVAPSKQ